MSGAPESSGTPPTPRHVPRNLDPRPHPPQLGHMHETVLEDRLRDDAEPVAEAHVGHELRLYVRGETGVRGGLDVHRTDRPLPAAPDPPRNGVRVGSASPPLLA